MRIKQSVCFPMMEPLPTPLPEFFERVARIGFEAVEIWKPDERFSEIASLAQTHGLRIASFSGHDSLPVGLNDPGEHERIIAELHESIDLAAQYHVPGIICFSGNRRTGQSDERAAERAEEEAIEACVQGFRKIAPYAEQKGVNLNMELLNTLVDHPGYQCDHSAWGLEVVKRVNSPRVKLLFDIYHMQIMEGNLIRTIVDNIQWIGHFHTAGVPGRHELDDTQEINYRGICTALAETPYDLFVGHEYKPTRELFETLVETYTICNQG